MILYIKKSSDHLTEMRVKAHFLERKCLDKVTELKRVARVPNGQIDRKFMTPIEPLG